MGIGEEKRSLPFRQASFEFEFSRSGARAAATMGRHWRQLLHGLGANQVMASYLARRGARACAGRGWGWGWGSALGLGVGQSMPLHCPTRDLDTKMCVIDGYCAVAAAPAYHSVTIVLACLLFTH